VHPLQVPPQLAVQLEPQPPDPTRKEY
jgi:hypothetical protein